ncbi:hypothetical protein DPSP01_001818 [Paraphaeosphaeria sporulosa]
MNAQEHGIENQPSQPAIIAQEPLEYMPTQTISDATLAQNWIRIFEYHHPTQMHVLTPYRESDQRVAIFIRGWFAFAELDDFLRLDAIASDPTMGEFQNSLLKDNSSAAQPSIKIKYPDKTYTSFDDWYSDSEKPEGWMFDEETHRLVGYTYWLSTHNASTQAVEQDMHEADARSGDQRMEATQIDADLSSQLEHMHIEDLNLELGVEGKANPYWSV